MRRTQWLEVAERGRNYVRGYLSEIAQYSASLDQFCAALDAAIVNQPGRWLALVPECTALERACQFEAGALLAENTDASRLINLGAGRGTMMPVESLFEEAAARVQGLIAARPDLVCVVADPMSRRGDAALTDCDSLFYVGDDVYHLLSVENSGNLLSRALAASPFWCSLNIVASVSPRINAERLATVADLCACATGVVEIACSAYDGESYVVWRCA
jgi:hypothetical protein